jgi:flagellar hook protein FlgE
MASALFAGVSGLRAHQNMLDVVGNNLANINTTAFKSERIRFADLLSETKAPATQAISGRTGGTNPIQVGLGVKTAAIDTDLKQGSLEATGNDLDLAIQGEGYFVAYDGVQNLYTRAGAFSVDTENRLVDPSTGYRIQRYGTVGEGTSTTPPFQVPGDTSIRIPFGTSIPGQATGLVTFKGNLSATAVGPLAETLTSVQPLEQAGVPATGATLLNALDSNGINYVPGDQIQITGTDVDGTPVNATFTYGASGTTVGQLLTVINSAFTQATATLDASGNFVVTANNTGPANLSLSLADLGTNVGSTSFNIHNPSLTVDGKDGDTVDAAIQVFDAQGTPHNLSLTFQKLGNNQWDVTGSIDPSEGTMVDGKVDSILFNDDGSFRQAGGVGVGDSDMQIQFNSLAGLQTLSFSLGSVNGFDGVTQYGGATSAAATKQDGSAAGFLTAVSVGKDGVIGGVFTNGRVLPIAQLAVASFDNPGGLDRLGNNYFGLTNNSGLPLLGAALSGGRGDIQGGTLESSNVDVALEFTRLIVAQRGFQVNARTITAVDDVMQQLANIIR